MKKLLPALLLLASSPVLAQSGYALHAQFTGIYWNPGLSGNGLSVDIQNGVLFGALYSYKTSGEDGFLTLFSRKASTVTSQQLRFSGDVFRTTNSGNTTTDVGNFSLEFVVIQGQPGMEITISSPYLNLNNAQLIRFGYLDSDRLSPMAGKLWGLGACRTQVESTAAPSGRHHRANLLLK